MRQRSWRNDRWFVGDGRLSILVGAGGAYPADLLTMGVYYPKTLPGNYVNVRLVGVRSNRSAIGARIAIEAGDRAQFREVSGGTNFGCMPFEQHFGLADTGAVESLEIRWPGGVVQRYGPHGSFWAEIAAILDGERRERDRCAEVVFEPRVTFQLGVEENIRGDAAALQPRPNDRWII